MNRLIPVTVLADNIVKWFTFVFGSGREDSRVVRISAGHKRRYPDIFRNTEGSTHLVRFESADPAGPETFGDGGKAEVVERDGDIDVYRRPSPGFCALFIVGFLGISAADDDKRRVRDEFLSPACVNELLFHGRIGDENEFPWLVVRRRGREVQRAPELRYYFLGNGVRLVPAYASPYFNCPMYVHYFLQFNLLMPEGLLTLLIVRVRATESIVRGNCGIKRFFDFRFIFAPRGRTIDSSGGEYVSKRELIPHSKPAIGERDIDAVREALESRMIASGATARLFASELALYLGATGAVATGSGTQALSMALAVAGVMAGDQVVIPTYACRDVADAVYSLKAKPVLVDATEDYGIDLGQVIQHAKNAVAAIVVYTFGRPFHISPLIKAGLPVVEDCAQALGAEIEGRKTGTIGEFGVFSFHATKLLATGEGGAVCSADARLAEKLAAAHSGSGPEGAVPRYSSKMSDIAAALGRSQLQRYAGFLARRREIADYYRSELGGQLDFAAHVEGQVYFRLVARTPDSGKLIEFAADRRVAFRKGVDALIHKVFGIAGEYPVAERLLAETLSLPLYPALTDAEAEKVVGIVKEFYGR